MSYFRWVSVLSLVLVTSTFAAEGKDRRDRDKEKDEEGFTVEGWVPSDQFEKAIEVAKEKGQGLVFMHVPASPKDEHAKLANEWSRESSLRSMIRVVVHSEARYKEFDKLRKSVADTSKEMPRLYFATSDMTITGLVSPRDARRLRTVAGLASSIASWSKSAKGELEKADALAEQGRFGAAMKIVNKIAEEDASYTQQVATTWESLPEPANKDKDKDRDRDRDRKEAREKAAEPAPTRVAKPGQYFPSLASERTTTYRTKATARLAEGRKASEAGNAAEARKLLAPLASDGGEFEAEATEARKLLAQLTADAAKPAEKPAEKSE